MHCLSRGNGFWENNRAREKCVNFISQLMSIKLRAAPLKAKQKEKIRKMEIIYDDDGDAVGLNS